MADRPLAVAFDIIETTFSIEPLRARLAAIGLPDAALEAWFASGLRDAFALAATGRFAPFRSVLEAALEETLARHGIGAAPEGKAAVLDAFKDLPAHPDANEAFATLARANIRIFALSNGAASASESLLRNAGLLHLVERVISVEEIRLSKPRSEVYAHASGLAGLAPARLALVAAHPWDVHGAKAAGLVGAFVSRGKPYPGTMIAPDMVGQSLSEVARAIAAMS